MIWTNFDKPTLLLLSHETISNEPIAIINCNELGNVNITEKIKLAIIEDLSAETVDVMGCDILIETGNTDVTIDVNHTEEDTFLPKKNENDEDEPQIFENKYRLCKIEMY